MDHESFSEALGGPDFPKADFVFEATVTEMTVAADETDAKVPSVLFALRVGLTTGPEWVAYWMTPDAARTLADGLRETADRVEGQ